MKCPVVGYIVHPIDVYGLGTVARACNPSYLGGLGWRIVCALEFWVAVRYADWVSALSSASIWGPPQSGGPPGCLRRGEPAQVEMSMGLV